MASRHRRPRQAPRSRAAAAMVVAGLALGALPGSAAAVTIPVSIPGDTVANDGTCSLREAVGAANTDTASGAAVGECPAGAGADVVLLGPGTFSLTRSGAADADVNSTGDLDATGEVTLRGAGATATTIDASTMAPARDRVLDVRAGATVTVDSLGITGGRAPDGTNGTTVNGAAGSPGADASGTAGQAAPAGGGIRNAGTLLVTASRLSGNQTGRGGDGGGGIGGAGTGTSHGGAGTGSVAGDGGSGGGIYSSGVLTVVNSTITANRAGDGGTGGIGNGGKGTSYGGNGLGKRAGNGGVGGGVAAGGTLTLDGATVSGNFSGAGGAGGPAGGGNGSAGSGVGVGGAADGADGGTGGSGGGLFTAAITTVVASTFSGNSAGAGGGGGIGAAGASPDGPGPTPNASGGPGGAAGDGGGAWSAGGDPKTITNVTVTANSVAAGGDGAGAFGTTPHRGSGGEGGTGAGVANAGGPLALLHVTVAGNGAPGPGGQPGNNGSVGTAGAAGAASAIDSSAGTTTSLRDSVTTQSCKTPITDGGGNIRLTATTCPGTTADPKLGALADNGGPTQTMSVGPGSAAFDAVPATGAGCASTDQRRARRPAGPACDAGAFEFGGPSAQTDPATAIADVSATVNGTLDARGLATAYRFDYGETEAYGSTVSAGGGALTPAGVSANLTGLAPTTTYHYRLVAVGPDGGSTGTDATFTTTEPIPVPVPVPVAAPKLDQLSVTPKAFAVAAGATPTGRGAAKRKTPRGTKIAFRLSPAASVTLAVEQRTTGVLLTAKTPKRTCAPASKANRRTLEAQIRRKLGSKANGAAGRKRVASALARARCTLYIQRGVLRRAGAAGTNAVVFTGRIGKRALSRGAYRVSASAAVGTGPRSPVVRASFSIVKP